MTTHYTYKNGVFTEDTENYKKLGKKTAFTIYTGGVWVLTDCYFDNRRRRYVGEHNNSLVEIRPSQVLQIKSLA